MSPQIEGEVAPPVQRIHLNQYRSGLPKAKRRDHELNAVGQHDRNAVAPLETLPNQRPGESIREVIELSIADAPIEVGPDEDEGVL
jgi:hypothetical protein